MYIYISEWTLLSIIRIEHLLLYRFPLLAQNEYYDYYCAYGHVCR